MKHLLSGSRVDEALALVRENLNRRVCAGDERFYGKLASRFVDYATAKSDAEVTRRLAHMEGMPRFVADLYPTYAMLKLDPERADVKFESYVWLERFVGLLAAREESRMIELMLAKAWHVLEETGRERALVHLTAALVAHAYPSLDAHLSAMEERVPGGVPISVFTKAFSRCGTDVDRLEHICRLTKRSVRPCCAQGQAILNKWLMVAVANIACRCTSPRNKDKLLRVLNENLYPVPAFYDHVMVRSGLPLIRHSLAFDSPVASALGKMGLNCRQPDYFYAPLKEFR